MAIPFRRRKKDHSAGSADASSSQGKPRRASSAPRRGSGRHTPIGRGVKPLDRTSEGAGDHAKVPQKKRSVRGGASPRQLKDTQQLLQAGIGGVPQELADASRGERLQKVLAALGVASRRDCEQIIQAGRISVNGKLVTSLPAWVDPARDLIELDNQPITHPSRKGQLHVSRIYLAMHKPKRTITTTDDPESRRIVMDLIPQELVPQKVRLYPVGRLDADSTGLILMTNDGELAHRLTHPSYGVAKRYRVSVRGLLTQEDVDRLEKGLILAHRLPSDRTGQAVKKASIERVRIVADQHDRSRGDRTLLEVTLLEGQNREIRRMLARLGFKVRRLTRVAIGGLSLKGLGLGQCRLLTSAEVQSLRQSVQLSE